MIVLDREHPIGGTQVVHRFNNGYGASVVRTFYSYGGDEGLYELAVVKFDGDTWELTYDTPITNDVLGWLTEAKVDEILAAIEALEVAS
jgi:hypothetical protein